MSGEAEDFDLLAGIYVLGALEPDEAATVEELAERNPEVARAIEAWRFRLAPLAATIPPVAPPPELWARIATTLGHEQQAPATHTVTTATPGPLVRAWRSVWVWRGATAGFALAAAVAAFMLVGQPQPTPVATALSPMGAPAAFLAQVESDGSLQVKPVEPVQVAFGKDLELWALPAGSKVPVSLGVLPAIGRTVPPGRLPQGPVQLLVSLEPTGGSPTGQPTGPVLYGGTLKPL